MYGGYPGHLRKTIWPCCPSGMHGRKAIPAAGGGQGAAAHALSSLYKAFPTPEARRIAKKLIHYTPKHGSWLDIAEIELNVMTHQFLSRRIDDIGLLR